jgi:hypothetical protein
MLTIFAGPAAKRARKAPAKKGKKLSGAAAASQGMLSLNRAYALYMLIVIAARVARESNENQA